MKKELKNDEEVIAQEGDITINMKELKTSLPKLADELNDIPIRIVLKKLMLDIEIRFEILQHILKPTLTENSKLLSETKLMIQDSIKKNEEVIKFLDEIKELLDEV